MSGELTGDEQVVIEAPVTQVVASVEDGGIVLENTQPAPIVVESEVSPVSLSVSAAGFSVDGADLFAEVTYVQGSPANVWVINHSLDKYCSVTIVDSGGNVVVGNVQYNSPSQITVTFESEFSGKAYLN
jgi:hypothetical protein